MNRVDSFSKGENYFYFFCGFTLFFTLPVYFRWNNSHFTFFMYFYVPLLFYYVLRGKMNSSHILLASAFAVLFAWERMTYDVNMIGLVLNTLLPFSILIPLSERTRILDCFVLKIFPVLLGISVLAYLLWMFGTLNLPTWHVDALNKLKDYDYTSHVFFVTANSLTESMRFCSYYDEPGVVGTFSAIILFFYNRRLPLWAWIVYFVAGVLSFSFFFFGIMILYPITLGDKKMSQRAWRIILGIVIIVALFSLFERSLISQYVFDRFQLTDSGFAGDNRNNDYFRDYFYNTFVNSPELLFGSSNLGQGSFVGGSFSIEVIIYRYGLLFFGYGLLLYVYLLWKYRTSTVNFFATTLVWFLLTYQRPSFSSIYYYIFFTTILPASQLAKRSETGSLQNKGLKEESLVLRTTYKA